MARLDPLHQSVWLRPSVARPRWEIRRAGELLGEGETFKQALQVALRAKHSNTGTVRSASSLLPTKGPDSPSAERTAPEATENTISGGDARGKKQQHHMPPR
jgi:hypothetical protein